MCVARREAKPGSLAGRMARLHPTELLDSTGHVVARAGQTIYAGGGTSDTSDASDPCGPPGKEIFDVEGEVSTTPP